jgi:hypothetical protein
MEHIWKGSITVLNYIYTYTYFTCTTTIIYW